MTNLNRTVPDIFPKIKEAFPEANLSRGLMIAYKGEIYTQIDPSPDEYVHEETHLRQQSRIGDALWWEYYIGDPKFRLEQEIEAYKAQADYIRSHPTLYTFPERRFRIQKMAELLSGPLYGNLVTYEFARELLK